MLTAIIILGITSLFCLGIFIGMYAERLAWNRLIQKGIIPKPKQ